MKELRTVDSILSKLNEMVSERQIIDPQLFMTAAESLVILLGDENDKLFLLEQQVAQKKVDLKKTLKSVAEVNLNVEATELYLQMRRQKAKIEQIDEFIKLSKLQARLRTEEYRNN